MNKGTMLFLKIITAVTFGAIELMGLDARYNSGSPGIPHGGGSHRHRPHAPNDGHWHMKFHRGRR